MGYGSCWLICRKIAVLWWMTALSTATITSPNFLCKGQLRPRTQAYCNVDIFRGREASCAKGKLVGGQLVPTSAGRDLTA